MSLLVRFIIDLHCLRHRDDHYQHYHHRHKWPPSVSTSSSSSWEKKNVIWVRCLSHKFNFDRTLKLLRTNCCGCCCPRPPWGIGEEGGREGGTFQSIMGRMSEAVVVVVFGFFGEAPVLLLLVDRLMQRRRSLLLLRISIASFQ